MFSRTSKIVLSQISKDDYKKALLTLLHDHTVSWGEESTFMVIYILEKSGAFEGGIPQAALLEATNALILTLNILFAERDKIKRLDTTSYIPQPQSDDAEQKSLANEIGSMICDWNSPRHLATSMENTCMKIAQWHIKAIHRHNIESQIKQLQDCTDIIHMQLGGSKDVGVAETLRIFNGYMTALQSELKKLEEE